MYDIIVKIVVLFNFFHYGITQLHFQDGSCKITTTDATITDFEIDNVMINDTTFDVIAIFDLESVKSIEYGGKMPYLNFSNDNDMTQLIVSTNAEFQHFDEDKHTDGVAASITSPFTLICTDGTRVGPYHFNQKIYDINNKIPKFNQIEDDNGFLAVYKLPMPWPKLDLTLFGDISVTDVDFSNNYIDFSIDDNEYVQIEYSPSKYDVINQPKVHYASLIPKKTFQINEPITLQITVTDIKDKYNNQHTINGKIQIIPDYDNSVPIIPKFELALYCGTYISQNNQDLINLNNLVITNDTYSTDVVVTLSADDNSKYFTIEPVYNNIYKIVLIKNIEITKLNELGFISLIVNAENKKLVGNYGTTVIALKIVFNGTTTTTTTTTTTEPTPPSDNLPLQFLEPNQIQVQISFDFIGEISNKRATIFPLESITYSLTADKYLNKHLTINTETGSVKVIKTKETLLQNQYNLTITACSMLTKQITSYKINLLVIYQPNIDTVLTYLELVENTTKSDLIELSKDNKNQGCQFEIVDLTPHNSDKNWFRINEKTLNIDAGPILRNHSAFHGMYKTQTQLILEIVCPQIDLQDMSIMKLIEHQLSPIVTSEYHWIYTQNVSALRQVFNIEIVGELHKPVFVQTPLNLGYPIVSLAANIQPPYLCQIYAIDGNSETEINTITYSIESPSNSFSIDPSLGIIYPNKAAGTVLKADEDSLILTVHASNSIGSTETSINVLILKQDDISVLKLDNATLIDIDQILQMLRQLTNWNVQNLQASVIPKIDNVFFNYFQESDAVTQLSLTVYALEYGDDVQVIKSDDFIEKINRLVINTTWTIDSVQNQPNSTTEIVIYDTVIKESRSLIVAVILLAVIVTIYLIVTVLYLVRRRMKITRKIFC